MVHNLFTVHCACGSIEKITDYDNKIVCSGCGNELWVLYSEEYNQPLPWINGTDEKLNALGGEDFITENLYLQEWEDFEVAE